MPVSNYYIDYQLYVITGLRSLSDRVSFTCFMMTSQGGGTFTQILSRIFYVVVRMNEQVSLVLGAGDCKLEVGIAHELRARGLDQFQFECLELSDALLQKRERGGGKKRSF